MHRFFIPPSWIRGNEVTISGPQAHQIARVLRMHPGDRIVLLDNSGWEIEAQLAAVSREMVQASVMRRRLSGAEPRTKISLYQGVLKSNRFEFVLQKGTELGVIEFVPIIADRCVVSDLDAVEKKRDRWESIIQEAAEQSRRGHKPALRPPLLFSRACDRARHSGGLSLIPWEEESSTGLRSLFRNPPAGLAAKNWPPLTVNLFVGPEGGFTPAEVAIAGRYGAMPVTLGPRILRAETAGIAASAAVLYELGDMD